MQQVATKTYWHLAVVFVLPLLVYLYTMPQTVALEDDGPFIMLSYFNGVSHPPGYPLYTLVGKLFTLMPVGTVAARVHAASAVFAALSCVLLWLSIHRLLSSAMAAYTGALAYAFSAVFWSQSIIAEVYTLNTFFLFLLLYLGVVINEHEPGDGVKRVNSLVYLFAFLYGLSLSNHWPLMVLSAPGLFCLLLPILKRDPLLLIRALPLVLLGLSPYIWMVINSQSDPFASFMGPIDSWAKFYYFVSREYYASIDTSSSAGLSDRLNYLAFYLRELAAQFTWPGMALLLTGMVTQFRYLKKPVGYALILIFIFTSFVLIFLLDFDYSQLYMSVMRVFFMPAYAIAAIWLAIGLLYLFGKLENIVTRRESLRLLSNLAPVLLVALLFIGNLEGNNRHDYDWGETYARALLESIPSGATLLLTGDVSMGTVGYMHFVEGVRPDIRLLSSRSLLFRDRIFDPWTTDKKGAGKRVAEYVRQSEVPVYSTSPDPQLFKHHHWLSYSFQPDYAGTQQRMVLSSMNLDYLNYVVNHESLHDPWTIKHRDKLMYDALKFVVEKMARGEGHRAYNAVIQHALEKMDGILFIFDYAKQRNILDAFGGRDNLLAMAEKLYQRSTEKTEKASYLYFRGMLEVEAGNSDKAGKYFYQSVQIWPVKENASLSRLCGMYRVQGSGVGEKLDKSGEALSSLCRARQSMPK